MVAPDVSPPSGAATPESTRIPRHGACFPLSWGERAGITAIELRSSDFSPLRAGPPKTAGSGLKSALLSG